MCKPLDSVDNGWRQLAEADNGWRQLAEGGLLSGLSHEDSVRKGSSNNGTNFSEYDSLPFLVASTDYWDTISILVDNLTKLSDGHDKGDCEFARIVRQYVDEKVKPFNHRVGKVGHTYRSKYCFPQDSRLQSDFIPPFLSIMPPSTKSFYHKRRVPIHLARDKIDLAKQRTNSISCEKRTDQKNGIAWNGAVT